MHRSSWIAPVAALLIAAAPLAARADDTSPSGAKAPPAKAASSPVTASSPQAAARSAPVAAVGKPETAQWSSTTLEAAVEEANKKILREAKATTVTGEIVDVSCYLQLGRRGLAHVACGTKCINNGQPIGIVDAEDQLYLLFPEPHHPRRDGTSTIKEIFLPYLAQQVKVTGMMTNLRGGIRALYVEGENVTPEAVPDGGPRKH